jgi:hypothetical protein
VPNVPAPPMLPDARPLLALQAHAQKQRLPPCAYTTPTRGLCCRGLRQSMQLVLLLASLFPCGPAHWLHPIPSLVTRHSGSASRTL